MSMQWPAEAKKGASNNHLCELDSLADVSMGGGIWALTAMEPVKAQTQLGCIIRSNAAICLLCSGTHLNGYFSLPAKESFRLHSYLPSRAAEQKH
eukprot:1161099-Pelagomonas_calceolata.AAC.8